MQVPTLPVIEKKTGRVVVIELAGCQTSQHEPVVPDVTGTTRTAAHTKHDTDRAIAKEIHGRQRI